MELAEVVGELFTGSGRRDPYACYDLLRPYGPLAVVQERFLVASGYDVIDAILRDPRWRVGDAEIAAFYGVTREEQGGLASSVLQANPPDHTRMRRLVAGAFTPRRLEALRPAVARQAENLIGYLAALARDGGPVDFMTEFAYPMPIRVICKLLGVPAADTAWFREQAAAVTATLEPQLSAEDLAAAAAAQDRLRDYFTDLIRQRRTAPTEDLTSALAGAGDALSESELLANLILLLVAGFETTTNLLGNGLVALLRRPDLADALRADPARIGRYVEEMLRYDSPVQLTSRFCREEVTLHGVRIEPYSQVMVLLGAGNRDGGRFANPDRFDPDREASAPLSFGGGAHYCLGAALARMEAQIAFPLLLQRLPTLALAGEPVPRERVTLRGYAALPVTVGAP